MLLGCLEPMLHITSDLGAEKVMTKYERERERESTPNSNEAKSR